jgi:hypothetical protein
MSPCSAVIPIKKDKAVECEADHSSSSRLMIGMHGTTPPFSEYPHECPA